MTTYRAIVSTETDPEAPITAALMKALALNPTAITEGAAGAPRVQDAALNSTVTAAGKTWVSNRIAALAQGDVGTYAFLRTPTPNTIITAEAFGTTRAGSTLNPSGYQHAEGASLTPGMVSSGAALSGTWRCMGFNPSSGGSGSSSTSGTTLWLRIS